MNNINKTLISIIALLVVPISGLSIDIYVPSLPAMVNFFKVNPNWVQNTITIYLVGYAISQLFAGIVCDIFGRKLATVIPLILYIFAAVGVLCVTQIQFIWLFRFIQGFMVGFFAVAQRAIIVDIYKDDERKLHSMAGYITVVWSIGPIIAPVIGGYLQHLFNWQATFVFLIIYSITVLILVILFVPETLVHKTKISLSYLFTSYITILGNKSYNYGYICNGLLYLIIISFSTIGAFLVQVKMGYSPVVFGYCALLLGMSWFFGQILNKMLIRYSIKQKLLIASLVNVIVAVVALLWSLLSFNLIELIVPLMVLNVSASVVFANYFIRNSTMFPKYAGNAGSLQGAGLLIVSSIGAALVNKLVPTTSASYLILVYLVITVLIFFITRRIKFA
jgi:Bcr/CflA subfamily drug resistance transporter